MTCADTSVRHATVRVINVESNKLVHEEPGDNATTQRRKDQET